MEAQPFQTPSFSIPITVLGVTWFPPQGSGSLETLQESGSKGGRGQATYYEQFHSSFSWICIRPERFIILPLNAHETSKEKRSIVCE